MGGDWYDVFRLPDRRLAVTVGDVMGKGLLAAAGMGRVRNALRALALTDPRPAAVLAGLDRLFAATELEDYVTTVTYLVIDPETGEGQAGNAGHPPTLLLTPGALPVLDSAEAGTPLGWASPRRQHAFRLPPGSTAVFYSDGLVENRMRGLDSGLDELVRIAADAPQDLLGAPGRLLQYLLDNMLAGYEQDDDVTVLVMHVPAGTVFDRGVTRPAVGAAVTPARLTGRADVYKALPGATYGGGEEAGGLVSISPSEREACFPARSRRQDPLGRALLACVRSSAKLPSEGRGDRGGERCQLRGAQALPAVQLRGSGLAGARSGGRRHVRGH